jgi:hypothetical protein
MSFLITPYSLIRPVCMSFHVGVCVMVNFSLLTAAKFEFVILAFN